MFGDKDLFFANAESHHIYKLIKIDDKYAYLERYFKFDENTKKHNRGDAFALRVGPLSFTKKFVPVKPDYIKKLSQKPRSNFSDVLEKFKKQVGGEEKPKASMPDEKLEMDKTTENDGNAPTEIDTQNVIYHPTERDDFSKLILNPEIKDTIMTGIKKINMKQELIDDWGFNELRPMEGKLAINFYGPPGTGKTMAARALAKEMGKTIIQVDYANMISKWVGDTAKHIRQAFEDAKKADAILFFDEADSMLSKRIEQSDGGESNSINQNRNVLMQELDRFNNIVVFATNFFKNYDEALLRRISQHIKFELPNEESRLKILEIKIPQKAKEKGKIDESVDLTALSKISEGFSGSDLENIVANAIEYCATSGRQLDQKSLLKELLKIRKTKDSHGSKSGRKGYQGTKIGIGPLAE
jgi:SpoVK/Ycf46/Vps4 family AAA+-type ATPase